MSAVKNSLKAGDGREDKSVVKNPVEDLMLNLEAFGFFLVGERNLSQTLACTHV